ncbi:tetratricopeptide repeat-containing sensor histidine kinase [Sphingobacterium hungaricum]|uniref:histidine kinase n=1 Tax=Sphingobacterium hungaricum TaxID=2082723 RepID=A0A928YP23_9SPHI|nr:tetratricopeptide repeat protein [Sphingobacterium hungaricum]MBE8712661.1 hypothetical protein [Sphingobacterium hungaricum]
MKSKKFNFNKKQVYYPISFILIQMFFVVSLAKNRTDPDKIHDVKDTNYVNRLIQQSSNLWSSKPDSLILLADQALLLSIQLNYSKGEMSALKNLGAGYYEKGDYLQSIFYYNRLLGRADSLKDYKKQAESYSHLATSYIALGDHSKATQMLYQALRIAEKYDLKLTSGHIFHNLGMVHHYQGKTDDALNFYNKSKIIYESLGDTSKSTFILGNMAHLYLNKKDYKKAGDFYNFSLVLAEKYDNKKGKGNALQSLGNFLVQQNMPLRALDFYLKAKKILESTGEKTEYLRLLENLSHCYIELNDDKLAFKYAYELYNLSVSQKQLYYIHTSADLLSKWYEKNEEFKKALSFLKQSKNAADSLYNDENKQNLVRLEEKYKYEKNEAITELVHTSQLEKKQKLLVVSSVVAVSLVIVAMLLIINLRQRKRSHSELIDSKEFIEKQNVSLEEANSFKEHLLGVMTHDMRTPISSLNNILQLFDSNLLTSEEIQRLMLSCHREINEIVNLTDNLLLWIGAQIYNRDVEKVRFKLGDLLEDEIGLQQLNASKKKIKIILQIDENLEAFANKESITIVIRNLINNSLKFCNPGDQINISAALSKTDQVVTIRVADTGVGMPKSLTEKLLKLNKRKLSRLGTNGEEGSGLGLQLCLYYLSLNGSELCVESTDGQGSKFWFELPS